MRRNGETVKLQRQLNQAPSVCVGSSGSVARYRSYRTQLALQPMPDDRDDDMFCTPAQISSEIAFFKRSFL
jgi:hypothetical protein